MSEQKLTVYQKLQKVLATGSVQSLSASSNSYNIQQQHQPNDIVDIARSPQEKDFKILQAKQQKLMARQWYRAQQDINNQSLAGLNDVRLMLRDSDLMDTMPEIATAMDIVSEEACLSFDTEIKLLDGTIKTIEDIYKDELKNFWVYSVDENGKPKPSLVQCAIYKGEKEVYEIVLDDLTTIKCTPNHKWLLSSNEWVESSDLKVGDSLMSIYNKLDYKGYEKIKSTIEDKFTHTHIQLFNHKIISIKELNRKIKVYDLKNSSCNKAFGVKCNNGLIISHNCYIGESGSLINISSGSERVKGILQDLFVNRLSVNTTLPMLTRSMIKYGNAFWLLHTDAQLGVLGWKELPVYEIERYENGMDYPYKSGYAINNRNIDEHKDETRFVWLGQQQATEYRNWQIAHFRLLYDSSMLPYGVSFLHKARRHYRMLSMMEDMMFIYRLDRSVERRVFKINVGAIDEADVPAYVQEIANNFKRTPIIDPMTGQIDMRKNIMPVWKKTPIPLLDGRTITIEDLAREYENGKTNYVYSIQDDTLKVVPGKVVWCGKNYTANNMVKITLDDDSFMVMAPEHEVVMRDGSKKRADKLNIGESVMPFYANVDKTSPKRMEHYEKISESKKNHKIKKIEIIGGDDVYCMTVVGLNGEEDRHNFALRTFNQDESWNENGCFVSNCQTNDYFIPVREDGAASPIENLAAGQNLTAMDDIKYVQNKIVTALRVPKSFLNFEETTGDGKNLSLLDVRFMRTVNRIQQALLLELNKIATIHLLMLGFTDDLTNFTLEMENPSSQAEMLELENLAKKVTTAKDAVSDPGGGMPLASMTWAWRHIFKWSDKEIQQNLEEIRLETALAAELQKTMQIIKKTHLFDPVDNIYGEPGAEYSDNSGQMDDEDGGMGGGSGMGGGMPMGGDMDFGDDMDGAEMGAEGDMGMDAAVGEDAAINGQEPPMGDADGGGPPNLGEMVTQSLKKKTLNEIIKRKKHLQSQREKNQESVFERYMRIITKGSKDKKSQPKQIYDKAFFMNEEMNDMVSKLIKIKPTSLND